MQRFTELLWPDSSIEHVARHGLTPDEVEEAVFDDLDRQVFRGPRSRLDPSRRIYYVLGQSSAGRHLFVVLADRGDNTALTVTARDMMPDERRRYRKG
jgi:hypothetical protein